MKRSAPTLLLIALVSGVPTGANSQIGTAPGVVIAGSNTDLRPAYATPQEVAEGKRVAQASCAACHGLTGISTM